MLLRWNGSDHCSECSTVQRWRLTRRGAREIVSRAFGFSSQRSGTQEYKVIKLSLCLTKYNAVNSFGGRVGGVVPHILNHLMEISG
jgi:hypothetical protein